MRSEQYWNLMRARIALNVQRESEVLAIIGMSREVICTKMKNRARAVRKYLDIGHNLKQEYFIYLMNNPDFEVKEWSVKLKKAGDLDSGWNFRIEGYHLKYRQNA